MSELPTGTVTFLFTDIEGSTRLWEEHSERMAEVLAQHDAIVRAAIENNGGYVFATGGDGFAAAFRTADAAIDAATEIQQALGIESLIPDLDVGVRIGLHTGTADERDGDFFGQAPTRAARIMTAGWGGQVIVGSLTAQLVDASRLIDLGEHRLRDLSTAEHLYQLRIDGARQDFPPPRSASAHPNNLPLQHTSFLGRADLVGEVRSLLRSVDLITLVGAGGVGKTRLALQVAAQEVPDHRDGAWLCELAPATGDDAVATIVASALGARQQANETLLESVVGFLKHRETLLVLDNCEHVIDAAADLAELVLETCPGVRIVATSREALSIAGERIVAVPTLPVPEDAGAGEAPSVELFRSRALERGTSSEVIDQSTDTIVEICRRLDGLPLAIELAAARTTSLSPTDILANLDERFSLLTGGTRRRRDRARTLEQTIDWSYDLLDADEQEVFRRLGVVAASFNLDTARAVGSSGSVPAAEMFDIVDALVSRSLLSTEVGLGGETRYRYLETVRHYAEAKVEIAGELDSASKAHAKVMAEWVETCVTESASPEEQLWLRRLEVELPNLRRLVDWALTSEEHATLVGLLGPFFNRTLHVSDRISPLAARAISAAGEGEEAGWYRILGLAGSHELDLGHYDEARRLAVLATERANPGDTGAAQAPHLVALIDISDSDNNGDPARAHELAQLGAEWARASGDLEGLTHSLTAMSVTGPWSGDGPQPEAVAEAYDAATQLGAPNVIAVAAWGVGYLMFELGRLEEAQKAFEECAGSAAEDTWVTTSGVMWSAIIEIELGRPLQALTRVRGYLVGNDLGGIPMLRISMVTVAGAALASMGQPEVGATVLGFPIDAAGGISPAKDRVVEAVASNLTSGEKDAAFARGSKLTVDQLVAETLVEVDRALAECEVETVDE